MENKPNKLDNIHVEIHSKQLEVGDRFHYTAPNGITYFTLKVEGVENGSIFPMIKTANACAVLPVELGGDREVVAVHLLSQSGRPEVSQTSPVLKAVGAFCNKDETSSEAAVRCLKARLGISAVEGDLIHIGHANGFGDQYQFPIQLYIVTNYESGDVIEMEGCERVRMTMQDLAIAERERLYFNDETIDLIAYVLLRNQFRGEFTW